MATDLHRNLLRIMEFSPSNIPPPFPLFTIFSSHDGANPASQADNLPFCFLRTVVCRYSADSLSFAGKLDGSSHAQLYCYKISASRISAQRDHFLRSYPLVLVVPDEDWGLY